MPSFPESTPKREPFPISALVSLLLGIGFLLKFSSEWKLWKKSAPKALAGLPQQSLGKIESLSDAKARVNAGAPSRTEKHGGIRTLDQRIPYIRKLIKDGHSDPAIVNATSAILSRKCGDDWCVEVKNSLAEIRAIHEAIVDPKSPYSARYTKDPARVDTFQSAARTMKSRRGDCDCLVVYEGAMLMAAGYEPELVVIQAKGADDWSHIFLRVPLEGAGTMGENASSFFQPNYIVLDASMQFAGGKYHAAGWEPPGLSEVLATGRPAGVVVRARIFQV